MPKGRKKVRPLSHTLKTLLEFKNIYILNCTVVISLIQTSTYYLPVKANNVEKVSFYGEYAGY